MKIIRKTMHIFSDNSGETMAEVLVAFTLLSIMLVVFSEGIAWATRSEANASVSRNGADAAMQYLQKDIASGTTANRELVATTSVGNDGKINTYTYTYGNYTYTVYEAAG
ncbi:MAG: hypothetical protein IK142_01945 [Clostridiales bacterium]|nr:hypothetical protein [Clostridiales bacterium]